MDKTNYSHCLSVLTCFRTFRRFIGKDFILQATLLPLTLKCRRRLIK